MEKSIDTLGFPAGQFIHAGRFPGYQGKPAKHRPTNVKGFQMNRVHTLLATSAAALTLSAAHDEAGSDTGGTGTGTGTSKKKEPVINTVTMNDGRVVDFVGKRRLLKESFMTDGRVQVRLDFVNGETRTFTLPDSLLEKFAAHGAEQKLGDEIAGVEDVEDAVLAIDELIDRLYNGEWGVARDKSGLAGASILLRALVETSGKSVEEIKAFLKDKTPAQKAALRNNAKIKPVVDRLEAEKAAKTQKKAGSIDTDALLGGLGL